MFEEDYGFNHYIEVREDGAIVDGWSVGPHQERTEEKGFGYGDRPHGEVVLMNPKGDYQFRLMFKLPSGDITFGEENENLYFSEYWVPKYKYVDGVVMERTHDEIEKDIDALPPYFEDIQREKQEENKKLLAQYLESHPLVWTDGKKYSVTLETQQEMMLNYMQSSIIPVTLDENGDEKEEGITWHASKEASTTWTADDFIMLMSAIHMYIHPYLTYQESIKEKIYACKTKDEVRNIVIDYEGVNNV